MTENNAAETTPEPKLEWQEPTTGPGFSINEGYNFDWITRVVESLSSKKAK